MSATSGRSASAQDAGTLEPDERAELEQLRAEVAELRAKPAARQRRRVGWRGPVATVLIVLGCILAPVSVLAVWTANQVSDTSRYVQNITPLASNPAIQGALTDKISTQINTHINVTKYADQAASVLAGKGLPRVATALRTFAPSIAGAVAGFIHSQVHKVVASPAFARLWVRLNTVAHAELVKALSGQGSSSITIVNGQVTLSLGPLINLAKQRIAAHGLTIVDKIPPINPTFPLFSAKYLVKAQTGYRLINDLKIVLPILALLLLACGIYIARSHRRALIGAGLGLAGAMVVLAAGLLIFRGIYLNAIPNSKLPANAAAALFDTLVRFIKEGLRTLLAVGLVVAAAAFFTGPSVTAVRTRAAFVKGLSWIRDRAELAGLRTGPVGQWTYVHRKGLRIGATAVAALVFVLWSRPTAAVVVVIVVLLLIVLGLIELIGRPPTGAAGEPQEPAAQPGPEPSAARPADRTASGLTSRAVPEHRAGSQPRS
jgi:hypothetical protein